MLALACVLSIGACKPAGTPAPKPSPPAPATPAVGPTLEAAEVKAFLESLYSHYKSSKDNDFQMFGANQRDVFDPDMVRLLGADTKALNGELGAIDGDWLCQCQDFESLKATIAVQSADASAAKATADFSDTGMPAQAAGHDDFDLVKAGGSWRIHDIRSGRQPSLRQTLEDEIRSLSKGAKGRNPNETP
jgi:hypothetical protein